MRPSLAIAVTCALAASLAAQTPDAAAAARARLQKALAANAAQPSGTFAAKWGPLPEAGAQPQNRANVMIMVGAMSGSQQPGAATGGWSEGALHLRYDDGNELLFAGRRMLAKDATLPWCLRRDCAADGGPLPFVPDLPLLLQRLAAMDLAVTHQEVGTRDDRPVEILSATLADDQAVEALWSGLLPKPSGSFGGGVAVRLNAAGAAQRQAPPKPEVTADIAVVLDPATAVVKTIHVRLYQKQDPRLQQLLNRAAAGNGGAADEDEGDDAKTADAPLPFQDGLPQRSHKQMTVWDYSIELQDLGTAKPPELPEAAKALLGQH